MTTRQLAHALLTAFTFMGVAACGASEESGLTDESTQEASYRTDYTAPSTPVLSAVAGDGRVTLKWTAATDNVGVTHYDVQRSGAWMANAGLSLSYTVTGLANGTTYYFRIAAFDPSRNASISNTVSVTPVGPTATGSDTTPPTKPYLTATAGDGKVTLSWTQSTDNVGVAHYDIHRNGAWLANAGLSRSYVVSGLTNGTAYQFQVVAIDGARNMGISNLVSSTPVGSTSTTTAPTSSPGAGWVLLYEDHFNGTTLNTTTTDLSRHISAWSPYYGPGHAGNGLRRPESLSLDGNGNLVVTAFVNSYGQIVSGGMSNKTSSMYGRFETRVRTEADYSGTMSGVILTWPIVGSNLENGENNIYETLHTSTTRNPFYSFIHWPGASHGGEQTYFIHRADGTQWHDMAMEWTPSTIKIFLDGVLVGTLDESADPTRDNIPDIAHRLCIQLDAFKSAAIPGPVRMYVDYVRVYKMQ